MKARALLFAILTGAAPCVASAQAIVVARPRTPQDLTRVANPLWAIPLASLRQTRLKPLFSPTRRPPPPVLAYVPPPPPKPIVRHVAPHPPSFTLVGTIVGAGQSVALLEDPSNQKVVPVRLGQKFQGWRLRAVDQREITVENEISRFALKLPKRTLPGVSSASMTVLPTAAETQRSFRGGSNQRR